MQHGPGSRIRQTRTALAEPTSAETRDFLCAERTASLIARRACADGYDTLVAPVLPSGGRDFPGSVPGGLALSQETRRHVLRGITAQPSPEPVRPELVPAAAASPGAGMTAPD